MTAPSAASAASVAEAEALVRLVLSGSPIHKAMQPAVAVLCAHMTLPWPGSRQARCTKACRRHPRQPGPGRAAWEAPC